MGFLSKKASASVNAASSGGGYLQVSKLADGGSVRFALLAAQPLEGYEVWASSPEGQSKPFRFDFEPTPEDITQELGDFEPREGRGGPGTVDVKFFIATPVYNFDAGSVQVLSLTQKSIIKELDQISQMDDYEDLRRLARSQIRRLRHHPPIHRRQPLQGCLILSPLHRGLSPTGASNSINKGCCQLLPAQKSTLVGPTGVFLVFRAQIKVPIEDMTWHRPLQWFLGVM